MSTNQDTEKRFAPATERNREPIRRVLDRVLPRPAVVLEVASGTGQHAAWIAPRLEDVTWQPSDADPASLASIEAWRREANTPHILPPVLLDLTASPLPTLPGKIDAIVAMNLIHIAPWRVCRSLLATAGDLLGEAGLLFLYGPFLQNGVPTADSNARFDDWLRGQDSAWGVRNLEEVAALAARHGLEISEIVTMPANNLSVIFSRPRK